ncbi:MAG: hypothetical protein SO471_17850 [Anaerobutyricum hallii]|uniref:hypothetical protein n=1 Tax=Anaerobutyricum hallii TaxID=39488 RepID=UPI002A812C29|nr:hypothetical protein [Anaerobutyricum hallii]MDY4579768.1 hypothetical protein [Anaerobutyricum hallii]
MSKVNLEEFAGGALQEKFDSAMEQVLANMLDPNTPWKNKREINIKVSFEQNEDRCDTTVDVSVVPKLAASKSIGTRMAIGKNIKTGELYAEEYGNQVRGQLSMDDLEEPENEDSEKEPNNKVVDLRAAR